MFRTKEIISRDRARDLQGHGSENLIIMETEVVRMKNPHIMRGLK